MITMTFWLKEIKTACVALWWQPARGWFNVFDATGPQDRGYWVCAVTPARPLKNTKQSKFDMVAAGLRMLQQDWSGVPSFSDNHLQTIYHDVPWFTLIYSGLPSLSKISISHCQSFPLQGGLLRPSSCLSRAPSSVPRTWELGSRR